MRTGRRQTLSGPLTAFSGSCNGLGLAGGLAVAAALAPLVRLQYLSIG